MDINERIASNTGALPADPRAAVVARYAQREAELETLAWQAMARGFFDQWQQATFWQDRIAQARIAESAEVTK